MATRARLHGHGYTGMATRTLAWLHAPPGMATRTPGMATGTPAWLPAPLHGQTRVPAWPDPVYRHGQTPETPHHGMYGHPAALSMPDRAHGGYTGIGPVAPAGPDVDARVRGSPGNCPPG